MRGVFLLVLASTAGCTPRHAEVRSPRELPPGVEIFQVADRSDPVVRVRAGDVSVDVLVDTGAPFHVMSESWVWYAGLAHRETPWNLEDAAGVEIPLGMVEDAGALTLEGGWGLDATPMVGALRIIDVVGMGGLLSPHSLTRPGETIVVDLRRGRLSLLQGAADDVVGPGQDLSSEGLIVQSAVGPSVTARDYLVRGEVAGYQVRLLVDTGSPRTILYLSSEVGAHLAEASASDVNMSRVDAALGTPARPHQSREIRAGGTVGVESRVLVPDVDVRIGEVRARLEIELSGSNDESRVDGVLGRDVLSDCTLALDSEGGSIRCGGGTGLPMRPDLPRVQLSLRSFGVRTPCEGDVTPYTPRPICDGYVDAWWNLYTELAEFATVEHERCLSLGYLSTHTSPELAVERNELSAVVHISEGERYRFGRLSVVTEGDSGRVEVSDEARQCLSRYEGQWALRSSTESMLECLETHYLDREGIAETSVSLQTRDHVRHTIDQELRVRLRSE